MLGWVFLLRLDAAGRVKSHVRIGLGEGGFTETVTPGEFFGLALERLDDIDGTGTDDLAISGATDALFVCRLNPDGTIKNNWKVGKGLGGASGTPGFGFGASLARLPDLDGDGICELAVGEPDGNWLVQLAFSPGGFWIYYLNAIGTIHREVFVDESFPGFPAAIGAKDLFGQGLANLGDLDGDGLDELAVGAPGDDDGATDAGAVWLVSLAPGPTFVGGAQKLSGLAGWPGATLPTGAYFAGALAPLGDHDGDGVADLLAGAPREVNPNNPRGAAYVLHLDGLPFPAGARVVNGAHANPLCLTSTTLPRLGSTWTVAIDASGHPGATLDFLIAFESGLAPGLALPLGELLLDLSSGFVAAASTASSGGVDTIDLPVPLDPALLGVRLRAQGLIAGGGPELCNALEVVLGS